MSSRTLYDIGDVVEIGIPFRVDGVLTTPTSVVAYLDPPKGQTINSTDSPTRLAVELAATTLSTVIANKLDPVLTAAELTAGVGIVRVRFVVDDHPKWGLLVHGIGAAQGTYETEISVRKPVTGFRFTGNLVIT
jgi:hypothetical protein